MLEDLGRTFLDTNIYIKLEELVATETTLKGICKERNNVPLLGIKRDCPQLASAAQEVAGLYDSFKQLKVVLTPGVREQLKYKANLFVDLEEGLKARQHEYLFIQIDGMFGIDLRKQANEIFNDCLKSYQDMIRWLNTVRDNPPYQPSSSFEAINDYIGGVSHLLNILGNEQKYDAGTDQKLAAAVLDNMLVGREKTKLLTNDNGLRKLTEMSYLLLKSASVLMENNIFSHPEEEQLELYWLNYENKIEQKELSKNLDESTQLKLLGDKYFIHNKHSNNPKLSGRLADFTFRLLERLKL